MTEAVVTSSSNPAFEIKEKLANLEAILIKRLPNMAVVLRDIHTNLKADPAIVTLLTEDECAILVRGLKEQTKIEITSTIMKKKTKAATKITTADL